MKFTAVILLVTTWCIYPVTMNDLGQFISDETNKNVRCFYEGEECTYKGQVIYSADNKLYIDGSTVAQFQDFLSIVAGIDEIYVVTRKTVFSLTDSTIKPVLTFNESIQDMTCINGEFHVSLKKMIMNGYKFTHIKFTDSRDISTVDTTIVDLKSENFSEEKLNKSGPMFVKGSH